jgi:hypothetical protein
MVASFKKIAFTFVLLQDSAKKYSHFNYLRKQFFYEYHNVWHIQLILISFFSFIIYILNSRNYFIFYSLDFSILKEH